VTVTVPITRADLDAFASLCDRLEEAAAGLEELMRRERGESWTEGAHTVRANAARLASESRDGTPGSGRAGALPLSRPFGEWDYEPHGEEVWRHIRAVDAFWRHRLGSGDFEVVDG
jgi:hypothetical protein